VKDVNSALVLPMATSGGGDRSTGGGDFKKRENRKEGFEKREGHGGDFKGKRNGASDFKKREERNDGFKNKRDGDDSKKRNDKKNDGNTPGKRTKLSGSFDGDKPVVAKKMKRLHRGKRPIQRKPK